MSWLFNSTKRQFGKNGMELRMAVLIMLLICIIGVLPVKSASAAGITIKYDGKKTTYTGAQTNVTLDGQSISLGDTPGIIIDNTCMLPANKAFKKGLGASYVYDSTTKGIVIEQNDIIINMTLGSKTAYVNGTKKTLDVAPKKIKYVDTYKNIIYVPARFVAENLGYSYVWVNSTITSQITSPLKIQYDEFATDWIMYTGVKGNVTYNGQDIDVSDMPSISVNSTTLIRAEKVFAEAMGVEYYYDAVNRTVTLKRNDVTIVMTIDSNIALVNDVPHEMTTEARLVKCKDTGESYVMIPAAFAAKTLGYGYTWNSNTKTSVITRIASDYTNLTWQEELLTNSGPGTNLITNAKVSHKNNVDILSITGLSPFDTVVNQDSSNELVVEVYNVFNQIEAVQKNFTDGIFVNGVKIEPFGTGLRITLQKNTGCSYYTSQSGNTFQLILCEDITTDVEHSMYQMKFTLPEGVTISDITDEDRYYENTFILTLNGDYMDYFIANPILYNSSVIKNITLISSNNNTKIKVNTNKIQGYRINDCGDYIGVNVANPSKIYKNIVVLDAGHGGKDPGAMNSSTNEKTLTLSIMYEYAKEYFNSSDSEIKAYWTRIDDTYVPLTERAAFASSVEADLFISLHMNSASSKTANGLEVLYGSNNKYTMSGLNSKTMADIFKKKLISELDMTDRGVKDRPNLVVLKSNGVPAILIELGFISNSSDYQKISDSQFQKQTAKAIYEATKTCFEKYPTGR